MKNKFDDSLKLLIVSNMYPSKEKSFAGIFVKNQYEALKELMVGDVVDIFFMKRKFTSKTGSIIKYLNTFFRFLKILFKRYDIVHLHYFFPLIYLVSLYKIVHPKTKIIVTYHGSDVTKKINTKNVSRLKRLSKKVDFHIPVGRALAQILEEKMQIKADIILPVGVNDKVFFYEDRVKKYDFIYVGSFIHRKGVDLIIEIIPELESSVMVCLVGQGDYLKELVELEKEYSNVKLFIGLNQIEIQNLIVQSKFLLLPTRNEGFPTSTIESMYCGVPVLVSDIPQTKEQVKEGENGFIIPVDDKNALLNKMIDLSTIDSKKYDMMVKKTRFAFREISLSSICKKLIGVYNQVTNND